MINLLIIIFILFTSNISWADSKLSALSNNGSPAGSDLTYDVQSGTSYNVTLSQVKTFVTTSNVGISSSAPGQALDVQGTVRGIAVQIRGGTSSQFLKADGSTDSSTYLTGNQTITLSNDVTGSGTTAITATLKSTGTAGTYRSTTFDAQGRETSGTNPTTFSGYAISDSSANLRSALTDSTGIGVAVFGTSPNLTANVGIGSSAPGKELDVNGTIRSIAVGIRGGTSSQFLKADGSVDSTAYGTSSAVGANPSGTVGTSAVNGASANFMRADGAPAINLTMSPTWTGNHTFAPSSGNTVITAGNLGIGNAVPGQVLDVTGTVRGVGVISTILTASQPVISDSGKQLASGTYKGNTTVFQMNNGVLTSGNLIKSDANSNTVDAGVSFGTLTDTKFCTYTSGSTSISCTSAGGGGSSQWTTINTNDVYLPSNGNVGIGTSFTTTSALSVMSGNVGIGTWLPLGALNIVGSGDNSFGGNVGVGTQNPNINTLEVQGGVAVGTLAYINTTAPLNGIITSGNIGIGTFFNTSGLDVATNESIGLAYAGYSSPGTNSLAVQGNVGIGTSIPSVAAITLVSGGTTAAKGINFGDSSANLYRSALNTIKTDGGMSFAAAAATISTGGAIIGATVGSSEAQLEAAGAQSGVIIKAAGQYQWSANTSLGGAGDTGLSRVLPGILVVGNGTAFDKSGTLAGGAIGIGTFTTTPKLTIIGNIGIGTVVTDAYVSTNPPNGGMIIEGNVGIGTIRPAAPLEIRGSTVGSVKTGANTACTTTCGSSSCLLGEDTSIVGTIVACTDATADVCVCLGP